MMCCPVNNMSSFEIVTMGKRHPAGVMSLQRYSSASRCFGWILQHASVPEQGFLHQQPNKNSRGGGRITPGNQIVWR